MVDEDTIWEHGKPEELRPELASSKPAISGLEFQFLSVRIHSIQ